MQLEDLHILLNDSELHTFYPFQFKQQTEICSVVNITGGTPSKGGVATTRFKILTRESSGIKAINKSNEICKYLLSNLKGAFFIGKEVLKVEADTPEPLFIGVENGLYIVSLNYTTIEG